MATKLIAQAIIDVMNDVSGVAKSMTVGTGSNSYKGVSDKDVKILMRESMAKHGLSILPIGINPKIQIDRWEEVDTYSKTGAMKTKQSIFTEVETKYLLLHTSGESIELAGYGQGVDTQDKGAGKATTYALKNTLLNMFLCPTGVDTDNTHSDEYDVPAKQKPIFTESQLDSLKQVKDEYASSEMAIIAIERKYTVSEPYKVQIRKLYGSELPITPPF